MSSSSKSLHCKYRTTSHHSVIDKPYLSSISRCSVPNKLSSISLSSTTQFTTTPSLLPGCSPPKVESLQLQSGKDGTLLVVVGSNLSTSTRVIIAFQTFALTPIFDNAFIANISSVQNPSGQLVIFSNGQNCTLVKTLP